MSKHMNNDSILSKTKMHATFNAAILEHKNDYLAVYENLFAFLNCKSMNLGRHYAPNLHHSTEKKFLSDISLPNQIPKTKLHRAFS